MHKDRDTIAGLIEFYGTLVEGGLIHPSRGERALIDANIGLTGLGARMQLRAWRSARARYTTGGGQ